MASKRKGKKCGTSGCGAVATHAAIDGQFTFFLCAKCAENATKPPLKAKHVCRIDELEAKP